MGEPTYLVRPFVNLPILHVLEPDVRKNNYKFESTCTNFNYHYSRILPGTTSYSRAVVSAALVSAALVFAALVFAAMQLLWYVDLYSLDT